MTDIYERITNKGSKTFYTASLFFPEEQRKQVYKLYAYVRTIDDFIDHQPAQISSYNKLKKQLYDALAGATSRNKLVRGMRDVVQKTKIPHEWIDAFFISQEMDLTTTRYHTFRDLTAYTYGVAEVIGLMMARIMKLPRKSYRLARLLGQSMQYLNIIRDISEDYDNGRIYIPQRDMKKFGLRDFTQATTANQKNTTELIRYEIERFFTIHEKAALGLPYIPRPYRVPICASHKLYMQVARTIYNDPLIVFRKKVKPSRSMILWTILVSYIEVHSGDIWNNFLKTRIT